MRRARPTAGFTMIEVMVAILLAAVAIIGILALYMTQTRATSFSRHMTEASVLASDGMERLRTMAVPAAGVEADIDEQGQPGGAFDRTSSVALMANGIDFDLQVDVSWDEDGVIRTVTLHGRR